MEDAFHLRGKLVFTVCRDAPLRIKQAQARQKFRFLVADHLRNFFRPVVCKPYDAHLLFHTIGLHT